jgi:RiboL-PSP-HEPN
MTAVKTFYKRQSELIQHLLEAKELSFAQDAEQMLQKNLPLAAASFLEERVCALLLEFVDVRTGGCIELRSLVEIKAVKRQYHSLFEWDQPNGFNKFFSLFGPEFKNAVITEIAEDPGLRRAAREFIEIGSLRNKIVHQNYATFVVDKSADEIFMLFEGAIQFVGFLAGKLK